MSGILVGFVALSYTALLFVIAFLGDRLSLVRRFPQARAAIYALSLAVYCTSWTFFGSVGLAADRGFEFLAIYTGPILVFTIGLPIIRRIVLLGKSENLTSVADLLAVRYGKNMRIAWLATTIATLGTIPYIALQLKAIVGSIELLIDGLPSPNQVITFADGGGAPFIVALLLALFAVFFGTRHADATEHQEGLVVAIAFESIIKLCAFLAAGIIITLFMFGGIDDILTKTGNSEPAIAAMEYRTSPATWIILTVLSGCAAILLPRQFHMAVVENRNVEDLKTARWMFPLYLVLINIFVFPIALAGLLTFDGVISADLYVLALAIQSGNELLTLFVFIGGLSAATAMVIVACVALSIMISNDVIMPILLRRTTDNSARYTGSWARQILKTRRTVIFVVMSAAFIYYHATTQNTQLASIGLLAFAAIAQLAPAVLIGLYWQRANSRGVLIGLSVGIACWTYTLLLPALLPPETLWIAGGPFGIEWLKPQALFGVIAEPLNHGVVFSIAINCLGIFFGSLTRRPFPIETAQAASFTASSQPQKFLGNPIYRPVLNSELLNTISLYLGPQRSRRAFDSYFGEQKEPYSGDRLALPETLSYAEQVLSRAVGSATSRLIMTLLLEKKTAESSTTIKLLGDASAAIQENRDLLQVALDQIDQGILVLDQSFRLRCWNQRYRKIFNLSEKYGHVGLSVFDIHSQIVMDENLERDEAEMLLGLFTAPMSTCLIHLNKSGRSIEFRSELMPGGGLVITMADTTQSVKADQALKRANEELESRVVERTQELSQLAIELERARNTAEQANSDKTRFLAAAGHDILQPLNAARLYCSTNLDPLDDSHHGTTLKKIDSALDAAEDIITTVLDISRLDTGSTKAQPRDLDLGLMLAQIVDDSRAHAQVRGIDLRFIPTSLWVHCDRSLLRRLIQNLVTNAINYTEDGKVLIGARRKDADSVNIIVADTGIGISAEDQNRIFDEFSRLHKSPSKVSGLGLGLSIVRRSAALIGGKVSIESTVGRGSKFTVALKRIEKPQHRTDKPRASRRSANSAFGFSGLKVICVDNEPAILDSFRQLLESWGCEVLPVASSEELKMSLEKKAFPVDVLIVDYQLDDETGFDVATLVKSHYDCDLPIYMATANRAPDVAERAAENEISVIYKPIKPAALRALLSKHRKVQVAAE